MIIGKRVVVVLPAYNAALTLRKTCDEIPREVVDDMILVDDASQDQTVALAKELGIRWLCHDRNYGYGRNQKTCYKEALKAGADIVVMLHPDYQYSPRLVPAMASMIASGEYDLVLGSRILGGKARQGGMPLYKYVSNRLLTAFQNLMLRSKLSEFHTGYRAYSKEVLLRLPLAENSDGFIFDNEVIVQAIAFGFRIGEISCPTRYFPEASSIGLGPAVKYGLGVIRTTMHFLLHRWGLRRDPRFDPMGRRLATGDG
ncbi:MAG: glycosyltransferase family 2 protein [Thermodesulfobacteriota bacterium]